MCLSVVILSTQPNAGCRSPCFAWHQVLYFLSGTTDDWHITLLTSSPVHIGCVTVYLITISCCTTAMTSPSWPPTTKQQNKTKTQNAHLALYTGFHPVHSERKRVVLLILRFNKGLFCQRFGAKWGQCAFALALTNIPLRFWNQSHITWFPSRWQPVLWSYIRSELWVAHRSGLQGRGRLQAHQPTYSCKRRNVTSRLFTRFHKAARDQPS